MKRTLVVRAEEIQRTIRQVKHGFDDTKSKTLGWSDPGTTVRGNATTAGSWLNTTGVFLQTHTQYDQCGNARKIFDARDTTFINPAQIEYSPTYQFAYATLTTSPDPDWSGPQASHTTSTEYDLATGLVTATIDANSQRTEFAYNDPLNRLKQVIRAATNALVKNQTTYEYDERSMVRKPGSSMALQENCWLSMRRMLTQALRRRNMVTVTVNYSSRPSPASIPHCHSLPTTSTTTR